MLAEICAGFSAILLVLAVHDLAHALHEKPIGVFFEQGIPIAAPQNFDDVPSSAAKNRFQLLNNLAVASHRPIESLQIAVDDEDQVVELLARGQSDGAERFRFVGFAIADKGPYFGIRTLFQSAIFEITIKPRLVDGHDGPQSHRDRREFPKTGHEPGVRIRGKAAAEFQFTAEIFELIHGEAAFQEGSRVDSGGSVALKIDDIAFAIFAARAKESVAADP